MRDLRGGNEFQKAYKPRNNSDMKTVICVQVSTTFWTARRLTFPPV